MRPEVGLDQQGPGWTPSPGAHREDMELHGESSRAGAQEQRSWGVPMMLGLSRGTECLGGGWVLCWPGHCLASEQAGNGNTCVTVSGGNQWVLCRRWSLGPPLTVDAARTEHLPCLPPRCPPSLPGRALLRGTCMAAPLMPTPLALFGGGEAPSASPAAEQLTGQVNPPPHPSSMLHTFSG